MRQACALAALVILVASASATILPSAAASGVPDATSPFIVYPHHVVAHPGASFNGRIYVRNDGDAPIDAYLRTDGTRLWMQWTNYIVVQPHDERTLYVVMTVNTSAPLGEQTVDFEMHDRASDALLQRASIILKVMPEAPATTDLAGTVAFTDIGTTGGSLSEGGAVDSTITVLNPGPNNVSWPVVVTGPPGWDLHVEPSVLSLGGPNGTGTIHLTGSPGPDSVNGTGEITINAGAAAYTFVHLSLEVNAHNSSAPAGLQVHLAGLESFGGCCGKTYSARAYATVTNPGGQARDVALSSASDHLNVTWDAPAVHVEARASADVGFVVNVPLGAPKGDQTFALLVDGRADNQFVGHVKVMDTTDAFGSYPVAVSVPIDLPASIDAVAASGNQTLSVTLRNPDHAPVQVYAYFGLPPGWHHAVLDPDVTIPADNGTVQVRLQYRATPNATNGDARLVFLRPHAVGIYSVAYLRANGFVRNASEALLVAKANITLTLDPTSLDLPVNGSTDVAVHVRNSGAANASGDVVVQTEGTAQPPLSITTDMFGATHFDLAPGGEAIIPARVTMGGGVGGNASVTFREMTSGVETTLRVDVAPPGFVADLGGLWMTVDPSNFTMDVGSTTVINVTLHNPTDQTQSRTVSVEDGSFSCAWGAFGSCALPPNYAASFRTLANVTPIETNVSVVAHGSTMIPLSIAAKRSGLTLLSVSTKPQFEQAVAELLVRDVAPELTCGQADACANGSAKLSLTLDRSNATWFVGDTFYVNATITNTGNASWDGEMFFDMPFGVSVGRDNSLAHAPLAPGGTRVVHLTLAAAGNCRCAVDGEFRVETAGGNASATIQIHLTKDPTAPWIDIALDQERLDIGVGKTALVNVTVTNSGNSSWHGPLVLRSDANVATSTSADSFDLAPGESRTRSVTVTRLGAGSTVVGLVARDAQATIFLPSSLDTADLISRPAPIRLTLSQSAALGAASVGIVAGAVVVVRRKWPLMALGLYARIAPQRLLEHPARRRVREVVEDKPGVSVNEAERRSGLSHGAFVHHLAKLESAGILASVEVGHKRALYVAGTSARPASSARTDARIVDAIRARGPSRPADVARELGLSRQAVQYHLPRLIRERRLVVRRGLLDDPG